MDVETLHDGVVAALARRACDLVGADIAIDIDPEVDYNAYGSGVTGWTVWPLVDGSRFFGVHLDARWRPAQALAQLLDALSENIGETARFWAVAFPTCPDHTHPAEVAVDDEQRPAAVVLRCPVTGAEIERIRSLEQRPSRSPKA